MGSDLQDVMTFGLGQSTVRKMTEAPEVPQPPDPRQRQRGTDPAVTEASRRERRRRAMATGREQTILTGSQGARQNGNGGQVGRKTLLGE